VKFWDASAVLLLAFPEEVHRSARSLYEDDGGLAVWWGTLVECASAAARWRREGRLDAALEAALAERFERLADGWLEIEPSDAIRRRAMRLLRVHTLRAGDALQLAAALVWAGTETGRGFVTLDPRLADAARAEGFDVVMPARPDR
jgi:hypothetical protein